MVMVVENNNKPSSLLAEAFERSKYVKREDIERKANLSLLDIMTIVNNSKRFYKWRR